MKPEWFEAADNARNAALRTDQNDQIGALWIAIAAVAPLIAAAERERCAKVAENESDWCPCGGPPCQTPPGHGCGVRDANGESIAAAIRALD